MHLIATGIGVHATTSWRAATCRRGSPAIGVGRSVRSLAYAARWPAATCLPRARRRPSFLRSTDEAAALLVLIAQLDPARFDAAAVRFLGRACLERSFITTSDAQFL